MDKHRRIFTERRKGPDMLVRIMRVFGLAGWLMLFVALLIFGKARPEESFIDKRFLERLGFDVHLRRVWEDDLMQYVFYLMVFGLVLSIAGLLLRFQRNRRQDDGYGLYLILLGVISASGMISFLWQRLS